MLKAAGKELPRTSIYGAQQMEPKCYKSLNLNSTRGRFYSKKVSSIAGPFQFNETKNRMWPHDGIFVQTMQSTNNVLHKYPRKNDLNRPMTQVNRKNFRMKDMLKNYTEKRLTHDRNYPDWL